MEKISLAESCRNVFYSFEIKTTYLKKRKKKKRYFSLGRFFPEHFCQHLRRNLGGDKLCKAFLLKKVKGSFKMTELNITGMYH